MSDDPPARKPVFDPTINLGALIQVGAVTVGIVLFVAHGERDIALVSQEVRSLRESVGESVQRLTNATNELHSSIAPIGGLSSRVEQAERRQSDVEARNELQENRINRLSEEMIELRTNMNSLLRASQQNLPGAPGIRPGSR